jgi:DDE superfamily endonuclease
VLICGLIAAPTRRTVCGMLTASGLSGLWHHSRAHRFFATTRWSPDQLGLIMLRLIVGWLLPVDAPIVIAVDDTLFRRSGRKVHAACWAYDGSRQVTKGQQKLSRGNTFVIAAVIVELPFLDRPIALPVLARLWRPGGSTKTELARELINIVAAARRDRLVHVVADRAYICKALRRLPVNVTLTGPPPRHATLWEVHPDLDDLPRMRGRRGRPRSRGDRIGTPDQLASSHGMPASVTRYGRADTVTIYERRCLWYGVFRSQPVRVILIREPGRPELALVTTDQKTPAAQLVERYASRWAIEVAFSDAKHVTGVGEARNRSRGAVERTVPFGLLTQSLVIVWYHLAGHHPAVVTDRRARARWYVTKTQPSYHDMLAKLRRVLIAAQYRADQAPEPTPQEIQTIRLAWADAAA